MFLLHELLVRVEYLCLSLLVDKIWDMKYVGTCCAKECYRRMPHVCTWLHDLEIKLRPSDDPSEVKRNREDEDVDQGPNKRWKEIGMNDKGKARKKSSIGTLKRKLREQKCYLEVSKKEISYPVDQKGRAEQQKRAPGYLSKLKVRKIEFKKYCRVKILKKILRGS